MPEQHDGHARAAKGEGHGAGERRAGHAQSRAGHGEGMGEQAQRPRGIDQQEVQGDVDEVDPHVDVEGRAGVARGPQTGGEHDLCRPEQHGRVEDEEVAGGVLQNVRPGVHPERHLTAQQQGEGGKERPHDQRHQRGLRCGAPGIFSPSRAQLTGDVRQKADAQRSQGAVHQPVDGGGRADGGSGVGADAADHGGVHIGDGRLKNLFENGGPRQQHDGLQRGAAGKFILHAYLGIRFQFVKGNTDYSMPSRGDSRARA